MRCGIRPWRCRRLANSAWHDALTKTLHAAWIDRMGNSLHAALNFAADTDDRINRRASEVGLQAIADADSTRNVILSNETVRRSSPRPTASTSVRILDRVRPQRRVACEPTDAASRPRLARWRSDIRLMMPSAKRGKGAKKLDKPVQIPATLAARLKRAGEGRSKGDRLLLEPSAAPWARSDHSRLFARPAKRAGCDPAEVTIYSLVVVRSCANCWPTFLFALSRPATTPPQP